MNQNPIKRYLPKSLLGRAILILLFPIIFIEIVVGIAFIQRHFEQVTNQMSEGIAFEILYIQNEAENGIKNKLSDKELIKKISNLGEKFGFKVNISNKNKYLIFIFFFKTIIINYTFWNISIFKIIYNIFSCFF